MKFNFKLKWLKLPPAVLLVLASSHGSTIVVRKVPSYHCSFKASRSGRASLSVGSEFDSASDEFDPESDSDVTGNGKFKYIQ